MIRAYRDSDWSQITDIYDLAKPDEMKNLVGKESITALARDSGMLRYFFSSEIFVFEEEKQILGFAGIRRDIISWLFVHPAHRRRGVGRELLNHIIQSSKGSLKLNLTACNHVAFALYRSLGFEIYEEFEGFMYGHSIPAVRMILRRESLGSG
ncbi:GNAT family N-acetyltransferase [bacterium]|nr:GNAT family N-acetyltransferase [candidate division CSSED10-310 bacterium]